MRLKTIMALSMASALAVSIASAQTMPTTPESFSQATSTLPNQTNQKSNTDETTELSTKRPTTANSASQTSAILRDLANDPRLKDVDLSKIEIVGNTTPIQRGSAKYIRIDWTAVNNLENPKRQILAVPLKTEFKVDNGQEAIPRDEVITAKGDLDALVDAVLKVSKAPNQAQQDQKQESTVAAQGQQQPKTNGALAAPAASGRTPKNDIAQYNPPAKTKESTVELQPLPTGYSTEGCKPKMDSSGQWMIEQAAMTEGGVKVGECTDTLNRFPIKTRFDGCSVIPKLDDRTATMPLGYYQAQSVRYYVGADGSPKDIDEMCSPDPDTKYPVREDLAACGWRVDKNASPATAVRQGRLYYVDGNGLTREVDGSCVDSKVVATVTTAVDACPSGHRVDRIGGWTYERIRHIWTVDGQEEASPCEETGTKWQHYNNEAACQWGDNLSTGKAFPQYRRAYDIPGMDQPQFIDSVCQPDLTKAIDLIPTTNGCEDTFDDKFAQQVSFGTHRFYYMLNGTEQSASTCIPDTTVSYEHKTRTAKWTCDDTKRSCLAWTETYIVTPRGEKVREIATIRPGTPETPYVFASSGEIADVANTFYEGCDKVTAYISVDYYNKPDGNIFEQITGPSSTPSLRVYDCAGYGAQVASDWNHSGSSRSGPQSGMKSSKFTCTCSVGPKYTATRYLRRSDGVDINSQSSTLRSGSCYSTSWPSTQSANMWYCGGNPCYSKTCNGPANPSESAVGGLFNSSNFLW